MIGEAFSLLSGTVNLKPVTLLAMSKYISEQKGEETKKSRLASSLVVPVASYSPL
jgi:hypothetical protein